MKIKITTIREIEDQDYDNWIYQLNTVAKINIDGKELKEKGTFSITDDLGYTRATTTYEIIKD
jgi:hypothetical protein